MTRSPRRRKSRPTLRIPVLTVAALCAAGCGVPVAEHAAIRRDLERARAETAQFARRCEDGDTAARRHLGTCDQDRTGAEAQSRALQAELRRAKDERAELVAEIRALDARVATLQEERRAAVELRRHRLSIAARFEALGDAVPELAGLAPAVVRGRLELALPQGPTDVALDRIAEVLGTLVEERWAVEASDPDWLSAAGVAAELCAALEKRGVPMDRLRASAVHTPADSPPTLRLVLLPPVPSAPDPEPETVGARDPVPPAQEYE